MSWKLPWGNATWRRPFPVLKKARGWEADPESRFVGGLFSNTKPTSQKATLWACNWSLKVIGIGIQATERSEHKVLPLTKKLFAISSYWEKQNLFGDFCLIVLTFVFLWIFKHEIGWARRWWGSRRIWGNDKEYDQNILNVKKLINNLICI